MAGLQGAPPCFVVKIPAYGSLQPLLQRDRGTPAKFRPDPRRIDRIAQVMSRSIGDEGYQPVMWRPLRVHLIQNAADHPYQIDVPRLVLAADIVASANRPAFQYCQKGVGVILHEQPVAYVLAGAVNGNRLSCQGV